MTFEGKVAIVTGASRGIGKAIALSFAAEGAAVAINYRVQEEAAQKIVQEIVEKGGKAVAIKADVSETDQAEELVTKTVDQLGGLDILVNNAGISHDGLLSAVEPDDWWNVVRVNLGGPVNCTRAAAKHLLPQGSGVIINISSAVTGRGAIGQSNYTTSKGALNSFTEASAVEFAQFGIRVNAVLGGFAETDLLDGLFAKDGVSAHLKKCIPMRRFGTVEEIAESVLFLASPAASYITGVLLRVDGGIYLPLSEPLRQARKRPKQNETTPENQ